MKSRGCTSLAVLALSLVVITWSTGASARDLVLPAGTILQCVLNEPNFSKATVEVGDPVLCNLRGVAEFGEQIFPRGSYLVGHLESAKDPGHFFGKGNLKLQFDRLGLPTGDVPLNAKLIAVRGYKVDREGKIDGKGHAKRDVAEWILPPLWPWKVVSLPARGPRPRLKGETSISLRLMDDVLIPQVSQNNSRQSRFFQRQSFQLPTRDVPAPIVRGAPARQKCPQPYGPEWHFFGQPKCQSFGESEHSVVVCGAPATDRSAVETPTTSYAAYTSGPAPSPTADLPTGVPLFVMKTGMMLVLDDYAYENGRISYSLAGGGTGVISSEEVDWLATTEINAERGVRLSLHAAKIATASSDVQF